MNISNIKNCVNAPKNPVPWISVSHKIQAGIWGNAYNRVHAPIWASIRSLLKDSIRKYTTNETK